MRLAAMTARGGVMAGPFTREEQAAALERLWDEIAGDIFDAEVYGTTKRRSDVTLSRAKVVELTVDQAHGRNGLHGGGDPALLQFVAIRQAGWTDRAMHRESERIINIAFPKGTRYCY